MKIMKKAILLLIALTTLISCSKDDDNNPNGNLEVNLKNLSGRWYTKQTILPNGSVIPYTAACPTKRDFVEIFENGFINKATYEVDCATFASPNNVLIFNQAEKMLATQGGEIPHSKVTKLTANELNLEFNAILEFGTEKRTLVFTKD
jgi:hypothetical protein